MEGIDHLPAAADSGGGEGGRPLLLAAAFFGFGEGGERERDPKKEIHGLPSSFLPFPCKTTTSGFALAVFIPGVISWESAIGQERVSPPLAFLRSEQGRSKNGSLKEKRDEVRRKMRQKRVFSLSTRQGINYCLAEGKKKTLSSASFSHVRKKERVSHTKRKMRGVIFPYDKKTSEKFKLFFLSVYFQHDRKILIKNKLIFSFYNRQRRHWCEPDRPCVRGGPDGIGPARPVPLLPLRGKDGATRHRGVRGQQGHLAPALNLPAT